MTDDIAALQRALLEAVISGTPLPGSATPVAMPDRAWLGEGAPVHVLREGVAPEALAGLPAQLISAEELAAAARDGRNVPYLRFRPAERSPGRVRLTLELALAAADPTRGQMGLSGVQAEFATQGPEPRALGDPSYFAA